MKKYAGFSHKLGIPPIIWGGGGNADFSCKSGKLVIQIKDDYYIQIGKILKSEKFSIIFPKIWTRKAVGWSPQCRRIKVKLIIRKP